jgi:hypothetical protein
LGVPAGKILGLIENLESFYVQYGYHSVWYEVGLPISQPISFRII